MSWEIDPYIANGVALFASFNTFIMWLAPVRDVWTASYSIYKTANTESVATSFGFVAGVFNCLLWNLYAINRLEKMMVPVVVNTMGFLLNLSFVGCYFVYGNSRARKSVVIYTVAMLLITGIAVAVWATQGSDQIVGYAAALVNICMLFGPLAAAGDVIRSRSSRGLSLLPLVMTLVASMTWIAYNVYIKEVPGIIPNVLGAIFGILQIILFVWARKQEGKGIGIEEGLDDEEGFQPVVTPERPNYDSRDPEAGVPITRDRQATSITAMIENIP